MEVSFEVPIYWVNEKKIKASTTHMVGMNFFNNAHYHIKNKMKKEYHALVADLLDHSEAVIDGPYTVEYTIFYKNPSCDGSNIAALMEKFLLDAIQECELVNDDNVEHHLGSSWSIGGKDRKNPRCEVTIKSISQ